MKRAGTGRKRKADGKERSKRDRREKEEGRERRKGEEATGEAATSFEARGKKRTKRVAEEEQAEGQREQEGQEKDKTCYKGGGRERAETCDIARRTRLGRIREQLPRYFQDFTLDEPGIR